MDRLKTHVDNMFRKYKETEKIKELKAEVLSNLEAKAEDLIANGMDYNEAIEVTMANLGCIDNLIDENREIYINKYKLEYVQILLLYSLIAWILTIPLRLVGLGFFLNIILFICSVTIGSVYMKMNSKRNSEDFKAKAFINLKSSLDTRKTAWIIWILFALVTILSVTAIQFISNLWFSRPISISGPYQFAIIVLRYILPLFTILIPLSLNLAPKLILKYQVGEENEN